jgi:hypothetical protein
VVNAAYNEVIAATDRDRAGIFAETAARLGTAVQNVEKDFWVCWTLDALFNGMDEGSPRLLFKGGTSLSKAFHLIKRFSEDIDITVFRSDIGQPVEAGDLEALSGKQRRLRLDGIREACQGYINGPLMDRLKQHVAEIAPGRMKVEQDPDDVDGQTLLVWYPAGDVRTDDYIRTAVKIEAGAKSALDPHTSASVVPYIGKDLQLDLRVSNVITVEPARTFWDKIIILHGLRQWFDRRGLLRHGGQRVSRHYYDTYQLLENKDSLSWLEDHGLATDCATHARLFFGGTDLGLDQAVRGTFTLLPNAPMREALRADYRAMTAMIFDEVPPLEAIFVRIEELEHTVNR